MGEEVATARNLNPIDKIDSTSVLLSTPTTSQTTSKDSRRFESRSTLDSTVMARGHSPGALNVPDVLSRIMELTLPEVPHQPGHGKSECFHPPKIPRRKLTEAPWVFLLVSKFWNEISLSTPSLWSTFVVFVMNPHYEDICHLPSVLGMYLERSGNLPLTLSMHFTLESHDDGTSLKPFEVIRSLLRKAQEGRRRWRDVTMSLYAMHTPPTYPIYLPIRLSETPLLNQLHIDFKMSPVYIRAKLELAYCPFLKSLSFNGPINTTALKPTQDARANGDYKSLGIIFPSLTDLSLHSFTFDKPSPGGFWNLLGHATNIENLSLGIRRPRENQDLILPTVVLPKLRSFNANFAVTMDIHRFMSVPSLTKVDLNYAAIRNEDYPNLASYLQSVPVKHLTLRLLDSFAQQWMVIPSTVMVQAFMISAEGLETLEIQNSNDLFLYAFSSALRRHSPENIQMSLLPRLKLLDFKISPQIVVGERSKRLSARITELILECHKKYSNNFEVRISFMPAYGDQEEEDKRNRVMESIRNYLPFKAYCTETFKIYVDGLALESSAGRDDTAAAQR